MKKQLAMGLGILALVWGPATQAGMAAGDVELSIGGQVSEPDEGDGNTFVFGGVGFNFTDSLQLKTAVGYFESGGTSSGTADFAFDFHLGGATWETLPYIGAGYTLAFGDFDDTDFYNARIGIKHFVSERTSIEAQLRRRMATDTDFDDFDSTDLILAVNFYL